MTNPSRIPLNDLNWQWRCIEHAFLADLHRLFETSAFSLGWAVEQFEQNFASFLGTHHAIGVSSGTAALHLAVIAAGIGPGDKVLLPSHTFISTAWAVVYAGAEPILCDVEPATGTIDVSDAERRMQPGVKAIIPVHLYGQPADMRAVTEFAGRHGLVVIEDAAQAHGARYQGGSVGTIGKFGCFSFYPGKNLGAAGEGGLICTNDAAAADRIRALRNHAQVERYLHSEIGFNYRMDGIQGLILDHKLRHLEAWTQERKRLARRYLKGLLGLPLGLPEIVHFDHVYHLFVVRTPKRDDLREHLEANGISTGLHYPVPLHRQPCFSQIDMARDSFPVADQYARECLTLPLYPGMTDAQVDAVVQLVSCYLGGKTSNAAAGREAFSI